MRQPSKWNIRMQRHKELPQKKDNQPHTKTKYINKPTQPNAGESWRLLNSVGAYPKECTKNMHAGTANQIRSDLAAKTTKSYYNGNLIQHQGNIQLNCKL